MNAPELFRFTIPAAGVAKGRARSVVRRGKGGKVITGANGAPVVGTYTPEATRNFEALVKDFAAQAMGGAGADPLACPVDLVVVFRFAIPAGWPKWKRELAAAGLVQHTKKPDCSNLVKAIEDACNGVLFKDDGQVVGMVVDKAYTAGAECVEVRGFRRAGIATADGQAAWAAWADYKADRRTDHLGLGERAQLFRVVG